MSKKVKQKYSITTAKKRLYTAKTAADNELTKILRREFIDRFTLCDVTCKVVLESYEKAKGTYKQGTYINLDMRSIPSAMNNVGLNIPKHVLSGVFGGTAQYKKRGSKSAKKLRDGIVHGMNADDISEVVNRYDDLMNIMDSFLSYF